MDSLVLEQIPFEVDDATLFAHLHVRRGRFDEAEVRRLADEAQVVARPRALYRLAFAEAWGDDFVVLNGVRLTSRVLRVNLDNAHRVFAFVATGGVEIEAWQTSKKDALEAYWADLIAELAVRAAMAGLQRHVAAVYGVESLAAMNPGSLADWPLTQQRPLFDLVGDTASTIGVRLTTSMLMTPRKSVSGLLFPTAEGFASCQLCPRTDCPNRRAPYDRELFDKKYALA